VQCILCEISPCVFSTDVYGEELTQPASMTVQPGQSLSINCKVLYSVTGYYTAWIRQPAKKTLEWIGRIYSSGGTAYSDKLKNKFSISRDTSTNTITIRGQNMQTEDTALYYCAREPTVRHITNIPVQKHPLQKTVHKEKRIYCTFKQFVLFCGLCVELIQTRSTVLTPGQSLTLTCKVSAYSVTSTYCTNWIRQPAGKTLEWIGVICYDGSTAYSEKLKSRFQVTRDTSSNTVTLTGQNMQSEDTAVYYCARYPH
ncbi:hypothetical protein HF521_004892, partial [Silurus meridionalis]